MGGGEQGAASAKTSQQLLQEMQRQRTGDLISQAFQKFGSGVATQQPYMQSRPSPYGQALAGAGAGAQPLGQGASPLGELFPQINQGAQALGGGGISEAQLAQILARLGYGGQV